MIIFDNSIYSTGRAVPGHRGDQGKSGKDCNCIFNVPLDLNTFNNVEYFLNKMKEDEKNYNREFSSEDIFISSNGYVYTLNEDRTGFIEKGNLYEMNDPINAVTVSDPTFADPSGKISSVSLVDKVKSNYYIMFYYLNDVDDSSYNAGLYPISKCIDGSINSGSFTPIKFKGKSQNVLVKYISKSTWNSKFYRVLG